MPLGPVYRKASAERSTPPNFDRVADRLLARGLTYDTPVNALLSGAQELDNTLGAVDGRAFLVTGDQIGDRSAMSRVGAYKLLGRSNHGRQAALHVGSAAPIKHAVTDRWHEG